MGYKRKYTSTDNYDHEIPYSSDDMVLLNPNHYSPPFSLNTNDNVTIDMTYKNVKGIDSSPSRDECWSLQDSLVNTCRRSTISQQTNNDTPVKKITSHLSKDGFKNTINPRTKEIEWSDVARHFEPVSLSNTCDKSKFKSRVDQNKSTAIKNSLIFAPFCRHYDTSLCDDSSDECFSEEDICDDTKLKEHQIVL